MSQESQSGEIIFYSSPEGNAKVEVYYEDETFWLTQRRMAELFDVEIPTINYHLKEIFKSGEVDENSVIRNFRITAADNKQYQTKHYSLDAIIAIGYRVNSRRATQFRIWATATLKGLVPDDYLIRAESDRLLGKVPS